MALRQRASPVSKALPIASPSHRTTSTILATGACPSRSPGAEVRRGICLDQSCCATRPRKRRKKRPAGTRSEEHTSELQSLMRISYAVFCLKKKQKKIEIIPHITIHQTRNQLSNARRLH